jgi:hypothetical protein
VIGLMPFIETSRDQARQEYIRSLAKHAGRMAMIAGAVSLLPRPFLRFLLSRIDGGMDAASVDASIALCRRDVALVAFTLASHEFRELSSQQGWEDLEYFARSGRCGVCCELQRLAVVSIDASFDDLSKITRCTLSQLHRHTMFCHMCFHFAGSNYVWVSDAGIVIVHSSVGYLL